MALLLLIWIEVDATGAEGRSRTIRDRASYQKLFDDDEFNHFAPEVLWDFAHVNGYTPL